MKKLIIFNIIAVIGLIFSGMMISDPFGSKTTNKKQIEAHDPVILQTNSVVKFVDSLNGVNDTNALRNRGYKPKRGPAGGPPGNAPNWFQGNETFTSYEGPATGYVAANFNFTTGTNPIDLWLISPVINGAAGDTLSFFERSPTGSVYPDSIRVYWSASGDTIPGAGSFVELGRFRTTTTGSWGERRFVLTSPGTGGRFAINYRVVDGGPNGTNSDFIGIDFIRLLSGVVGITPINNTIPDNYSLGQNYPNPFNPSTKINFSVPVSGVVILTVFDVEGKEIMVVFNGEKQAGNYTADINLSTISSGVYFYRLESSNSSITKKMLLIK